MKKPTCKLCGEPMPEGEEMFMYHGFSGECPKAPLTQRGISPFKEGDRVFKPKGYQFPGTVVGVFKNLAGEFRYVVEMDMFGLLHIFNADQLEKSPYFTEEDKE